MADAALGGMGHGTPQFLMRDFLSDNSLDDIGAGYVHVAAFLDHEDPVRQCR